MAIFQGKIWPYIALQQTTACLLAVLAATNHYRLHFTVFDCSLHLQASLTKLLLQKQQANERMNERTDKEQVTAAVKDYYQYSFNPHQIIKKNKKYQYILQFYDQLN